MLLGDPYKFSISFDEIQSWNIDDTFSNGVLLLYVSGDIYPKEIVTLKRKLSDITVDKNLFKMGKEDAFREIYNITYPKDIDLCNDYRFDISPSILVDNNCFLFAVSDGANIRVLASKMQYIIEESRHNLSNVIVSESVLSAEEINEIILGLVIS